MLIEFSPWELREVKYGVAGTVDRTNECPPNLKALYDRLRQLAPEEGACVADPLNSRDVGLISGFITSAYLTSKSKVRKLEMRLLDEKWNTLVYTLQRGDPVDPCFFVPKVESEGALRSA